MRAAFVNPGGPLVPDLDKVKRYRLTRLYWLANDDALQGNVGADLFDSMRRQGCEVGLMREPSHGNLLHSEVLRRREAGIPITPLTAPQLAQKLDADLLRFGVNQEQCGVLADIEIHDAAYVELFLRDWRVLRPKRVTGWTLEPNQGGWFPPSLSKAVRLANVTVLPQAYSGDMTPWDVDYVRCDIIERNIPGGMVKAVYAASRIPSRFDGIAFRFDQLP